jgi:hypothetical protein
VHVEDDPALLVRSRPCLAITSLRYKHPKFAIAQLRNNLGPHVRAHGADEHHVIVVRIPLWPVLIRQARHISKWHVACLDGVFLQPLDVGLVVIPHLAALQERQIQRREMEIPHLLEVVDDGVVGDGLDGGLGTDVAANDYLALLVQVTDAGPTRAHVVHVMSEHPQRIVHYNRNFLKLVRLQGIADF